jgi:dipeptidase E
MTNLHVLALSSSRAGSGAYLEAALPMIHEFLGTKSLTIAFIPFASVDSYDDYAAKVREGLASLPHIINLVEPGNAKDVIDNCDAVMVGGGNTFKLLHDIYALKLFDLIKSKIAAGIPYIGWSAGSNITGASIATTNDMPIIQPQSFTAFGFFPFQINPHYISQPAEGHHGETRDQRLAEFIKLQPHMPVICLPEGTALLRHADTINFIGETNGLLLSSGNDGAVTRSVIETGADISFLL